MTREELLKKLQSVTFRARLTDMPSEGAFELGVITSKGANYSWIAYEDWFVYELRGMDMATWTIILDKLQDGTLTKTDLLGTDLERLFEKEQKEDNCNVFFTLMKGFQVTPLKEFYCIYREGETPIFFANKEPLELELARIYEDSIDRWEDMNTEELVHWYEACEVAYGIPYNVFGANEDDEDDITG